MAVFLEAYRRLLGRFGQDVTVRRYAGIGAARAIAASVVLRAHVARYDAAELGGRIVQGDRKVVLMAADLGALAPLSTFTDVVAISGVEASIQAVDVDTRQAAGAVELQVRG